MLFLIHIFPYTSDGPLWVSRVAYEVNNCYTNWWTKILGVSNIISTDNQVRKLLMPVYSPLHTIRKQGRKRNKWTKSVRIANSV